RVTSQHLQSELSTEPHFEHFELLVKFLLLPKQICSLVERSVGTAGGELGLELVEGGGHTLNRLMLRILHASVIDGGEAFDEGVFDCVQFGEHEAAFVVLAVE